MVQRRQVGLRQITVPRPGSDDFGEDPCAAVEPADRSVEGDGVELSRESPHPNRGSASWIGRHHRVSAPSNTASRRKADCTAERASMRAT